MRSNQCGALVALLFLSAVCAHGQNPCDAGGPAYSQLPADTTIVAKDGTRFTFNRCEYFDLRECLEIESNDDDENSLEGKVSRRDERGRSLFNFGEVRIRLNTACAGRSCFEVPVKVRIPWPPYQFRVGYSPQLYTFQGDRWKVYKGIALREAVIDGERFLEFEMRCPGPVFSWRARLFFCTTFVSFKVKARSWQQLDTVRLSDHTPLSWRRFDQTRPGRRKMIVSVYCNSEDSISMELKGIDRNGQPATIRWALSEYAHGRGRRPCTEIWHWWDFFHRNQGEYFRKYFAEARKSAP